MEGQGVAASAASQAGREGEPGTRKDRQEHEARAHASWVQATT